ncbi:unnamed protein product [Mycena citricolor]|uniref:AAA+ ATPase domain-containing protein n=1 Tax=Mycena citricolor TaxID=2018698 RepID=A0AAD2HQ59_9AGAR|nr:unnamed protein product [Mycena citricolor]
MAQRLQGAESVSFLESGAIRQSLLLLRQIGEASNLGPLKGFAGIATLVLDTCQTASSNKSDASSLGQDVAQLALAVASQVEDNKADIAQDAELLDSIRKLCLELEAVHASLQTLFKRDSLSWFVKQSQDQVRLVRLQRDIKHAIDLFSLQSSVRLQHRLTLSEDLDDARRSRILSAIQDMCQSVMSEMKSAKQTMETLPLILAPVIPRVPRCFFGREETVETVIGALVSASPARITILGAAGIGKTSVAIMALVNPSVVECFGDRRYFISCDSASSTDDLVSIIAGSLGLQGSRLRKKIIDFFAATEQRSVLVLDNFESPWDAGPENKKAAEELLALLCSLDTLDVVVTMRGAERPAGVQWSRPFLPQLGPLDNSAARKAFLALSDCLENDDGIDQLLAVVDNVPLGIVLMANLTETDSTETLFDRWREEQTSLLHRTADRSSSLDVSISISLNSPRMKAEPEALVLLSLLSVLPDGIENRQLGAIFPNLTKSRRALSTLWHTSLAYNDGNNHTRVLAPIRAHMRVHYPPSEMHLLPVYTYYMALAGLACDLGGPHGQDIVKKIVPEIGNIHSVVDLALRDTQPALIRAAIDAAINLAKFLRYTQLGNPDTIGLASSVLKHLDDPILQADVLFNLSWVKLVVAGDSPEAEQLCNDALAIYETQENLDGRAQSTWLLGQILKTSKRQKECKLKFEEALALATEAQNQNCRAKCLSCLSEAQFHAGDAATAEALSLEALELFRQEEHLTNIGMTLYFLGRIADFRDDASAEERYEEAEAVLQQAGASSHAALALIGKGDILVARCQYREAQQIYTKAVQAFRTNSSLQTTYGAFAQLSLGTAEAYLYNYTEAKRWLDAAWKTFEKTPVVAHGRMHLDIVFGSIVPSQDRFQSLTDHQGM